MNVTRTSNPTLRDNTFSQEASQAGFFGESMTIKGAINKTAILFGILLIAAAVSWKLTISGSALALGLMLPAVIIGFIFALITTFSKKSAKITAPIYAACEGFTLGAISSLFNMQYSGIVFQAIMLTMLVFGLMLFMYRANILRASSKLVKGIVIATAAIGIFYIISFIASFFTTAISDYLFANPGLAILISVIIVGVAAFNLILDFDFIERASQSGSPKYMEWYAGFSLMVTLVWLYIEILRLLSYLRRD